MGSCSRSLTTQNSQRAQEERRGSPPPPHDLHKTRPLCFRIWLVGSKHTRQSTRHCNCATRTKIRRGSLRSRVTQLSLASTSANRQMCCIGRTSHQVGWRAEAQTCTRSLLVVKHWLRSKISGPSAHEKRSPNSDAQGDGSWQRHSELRPHHQFVQRTNRASSLS